MDKIQQVWLSAYCAAITAGQNLKNRVESANYAIRDFNEKFPESTWVVEIPTTDEI
jgi:hypothetical protein